MEMNAEITIFYLFSCFWHEIRNVKKNKVIFTNKIFFTKQIFVLELSSEAGTRKLMCTPNVHDDDDDNDNIFFFVIITLK